MPIGPSTLPKELEDYLNGLGGGGSGAMYGTCETAAGIATKVITLENASAWELSVGSTILVKFTATNTATNPLFNVNGTGAKKVFHNAAALTTENLELAGTANILSMYAYDGTNWVFISWSFTDYAYLTKAQYDELNEMLDNIGQ